MMNKKFKFFAAVVIALYIAAVMGSACFADLGGFAGNSDYGGDFDVDFGDSFDYDYGGSGGDIGDLFFLLYLFDSPPAVIAIVIVLVVLYILRKKRGGNTTHNSHPQRPIQGARQTDSSLLRPMSEFKSLDPLFNEAEFTDKISNMYVRFQNCWQEKDLSPLRGDMTDAFYNQTLRQLEQLIKNRQTNMIENIAVLGVDLRGFMQDEANDTVVVSIRTRINDYYIDDTTKEVVRGYPHADKFMTYEWTMIRKKGVLTKETGESTALNCPNCGAALDVNHSAECEYCGSVITNDDFDWVLSSIKGISQQTA